ncbi:hypothetical protein [Methylobacterium sp. WL116]|uniref:hypothetical protein n=1 Tax=Methylobacterium sp. WL116 TaxID=2603889 RepID=UPI001FEEB99B|nr:hypothetical protein [Methylobacterium sp. WL116]
MPLVVEALARPAYQPLLRRVSQLAILQRLERWVATKPRWLILLILAVPFFGVEPLKVLGLVWIGEGLFLRGLGLLAFAYGASFVLVERIYQAGRDKLRSYRWLARCIDVVVAIRDAVLASLRATRAWRWATEIAAAAAAIVRPWRQRIRVLFQHADRPRRV